MDLEKPEQLWVNRMSQIVFYAISIFKIKEKWSQYQLFITCVLFFSAAVFSTNTIHKYIFFQHKCFNANLFFFSTGCLFIYASSFFETVKFK